MKSHTRSTISSTDSKKARVSKNDSSLHSILSGDLIVPVLKNLDLNSLGCMRLVCHNWNSIICSILEKTKSYFKNNLAGLDDYVEWYGADEFPLQIIHFSPTVNATFKELIQLYNVKQLLWKRSPIYSFEYTTSMFSITTEKHHYVISQCDKYYNSVYSNSDLHEYRIVIENPETKSSDACNFFSNPCINAHGWSCNSIEFFEKYAQELGLKTADHVLWFFLDCGRIAHKPNPLSEKAYEKEEPDWDNYIFPVGMDLNECQNIVSRCEQVLGSSICKGYLRKMASEIRISKYIYKDTGNDDQWLEGANKLFSRFIRNNEREIDDSVLKQLKSEFNFIDYILEDGGIATIFGIEFETILETYEVLTFTIFIKSTKEWITFDVRSSSIKEKDREQVVNLSISSKSCFSEEESRTKLNETFQKNYSLKFWNVFFCSLLPSLFECEEEITLPTKHIIPKL